MHLSGPTLAIFAKQPLPGRVKTRLCPPLTAQQAAELYEVSLRETLLRFDATDLTLVLCYCGQQQWFAAQFPDIPLLLQTGRDLGQRLASATDALFNAGASPLLIIGSDSPDLPLALVDQALADLHQSDLVTIPSGDGGDGLVGMRRATPEIFNEIPWSSSQVLAATRLQAGRRNLSYRETASWSDLDEVDDLTQLLRRSPQSRTARHIRNHLGQHF
mgnify:CR=1 FL=1